MRGTQTRPAPRFCAANSIFRRHHHKLPDPSFFSPPANRCSHSSNQRAEEAATGPLCRAVAIARTTPSRGVPPANRLDQRPLVASSSLPIQATTACIPPNPRHRLRGVLSSPEAEEVHPYCHFFLKKKLEKRKKSTKKKKRHATLALNRDKPGISTAQRKKLEGCLFLCLSCLIATSTIRAFWLLLFP